MINKEGIFFNIPKFLSSDETGGNQHRHVGLCPEHPNRKPVFEGQLWRPKLTSLAVWGVVVA